MGFITWDTRSASLGLASVCHPSQTLNANLSKESFYSKLKKFSDDGNTNLYVSNIPKNMNEHVRLLIVISYTILILIQELASIFAPHKVCSSRILRDSSGTGRGVGFAR